MLRMDGMRWLSKVIGPLRASMISYMILFKSPHPHYHWQSRASSGREESQPVNVPPLAVFSTWSHPNSDHHHEHYPCFYLLSQSSL